MFSNIFTKNEVFDANGKGILKKLMPLFLVLPIHKATNKHLFCLQFPAAKNFEVTLA